MFKFIGVILLLSFNSLCYASTDVLNESEYFKTNEVGYSLKSKEGIKLFINLEIKKLVKSSSKWTAVVEFKSVKDSNIYFQIVKVINPLDQNIVVYAPHLYSVLNNHEYSIELHAYNNLKMKTLITTHKQSMYLSVESELLNQYGIRAL